MPAKRATAKKAFERQMGTLLVTPDEKIEAIVGVRIQRHHEKASGGMFMFLAITSNGAPSFPPLGFQCIQQIILVVAIIAVVFELALEVVVLLNKK